MTRFSPFPAFRRSGSLRRPSSPGRHSRGRRPALAVLQLEDRLLPSYSFQLVASTGDTYTDVGGVAINAQGTVAYRAGYASGYYDLLATRTDDTTTVISRASDGVFRGGVPGGLTSGEHGRETVVFTSQSLFYSGAGIWAGKGGPVSVVATTAARSPWFDGVPVVNDAGTVAWRGILPADGDAGIFTRSVHGGPITTIATTGTPFGDDAFAAFSGMSTAGTTPAINNKGTVAFLAHLASGIEGVFVADADGTITTLADTTNPAFADFQIGDGIDNEPALNDAGAVFVRAGIGKEGGTALVLIGPDGGVTTVATTLDDSPFARFGTTPGLNTEGAIAYRAVLKDGTHAIYVGPPDKPERVLGTGDPLFGSAVVSFTSLRGFNDAGQFAFVATLEDGRTVVGRGDPDDGGNRPGVPRDRPPVALAVTWAATPTGMAQAGGIDYGQRPPAAVPEPATLHFRNALPPAEWAGGSEQPAPAVSERLAAPAVDRAFADAGVTEWGPALGDALAFPGL